ncbi:hypothetical protein MLD38_006668 [Melastoma candidum]|uniref:Uncharacterized protein n=1 Tax=Melastoma candidum TaxID=119954 RepID=A0ACB9RX36_9MYRT|nr:hypothetical protein MLD38_006668 [Melastoma candidum]
MSDASLSIENNVSDQIMAPTVPKIRNVCLFDCDVSDALADSDSYRRRIFFNYEKRIRLPSPLEKHAKDSHMVYGGEMKVFECFAMARPPSGGALMTPADLTKAVVLVFPPSESDLIRKESLRGEECPVTYTALRPTFLCFLT